MKRLTLLRHAKTERDSLTGRDIDRRLEERGRRDAERMGAEMRSLGLDFDLIITSPAARAAETAKLAGLSAVEDERIYDAPTGQLLTLAQEADASVASLLLIGHNPGFERLASQLIGENVDMPTGSLIEIELPIDDWRDLGAEYGQLIRFLKPKKLP